MTQNIKQTRPADSKTFDFRHLREFAESADVMGLPDSTPVKCWVSARDEVYSLETDIKEADNEAAPSDGEIPSAPQSGEAQEPTATVERRTIVVQQPTGRVVEWRRWGRLKLGRFLTLGDVRALIARVDNLGLPSDTYVVRGWSVDRSGRGYVWRIYAEPRKR